ncbi:TonB-dependent receptor domain-containing protein [uncultured Sphingomonas sp.]|uniref:TonB-dependent receptor domain-containing protein n=1 Tax=uncultured Sphingomonas sp. TaxID=158754 RepID=UPI0035CB55B9
MTGWGNGGRARTTVAATIAAMVIVGQASAQRSGDNAVTASEDAFGTSVGNESIGLYNAYDVRGFSAVDAGNARIAGLYFDQQIDPINHLIAEAGIRVGISAQGYPLPAPTGIVDYALRKTGDKPVYSGLLALGPFRGVDAEVDLQLPISPGRLSLVAGATLNRADAGIGVTEGYANAAVMPRWTPTSNLEMTAFASGSWAWDAEAAPAIFVGGNHLPPRIKRSRFYGQKWADNRNTGQNHGVLGTWRLGQTTIRGGLFRSVFGIGESYADLFLNVTREGEADHVIIANRGQRFASNSGEVRVSRQLGSKDRPHLLHLIVRGRDQRRTFGGDVPIDLGRALVGVPRPVARVPFQVGPRTRDRVRQITMAIAYEGRPFRWLETSAGLQRPDYRKTTRAPGQDDPVLGSDRPWLYNVAAAVRPTARLAIYASVTRGLEEGGVAPSNALNKDAASPALRTRQIDAGIRYAVTDGLKAVAGVFAVNKPYFNLDADDRYRQLGDYSQRGVELSLAGSPAKGLYVVAGTLLLDPRVTGEEVDAGTIGRRPVGQTRRLTIVSGDYQLPRLEGVSINATMTSVARRIASRDNRLALPARAVIDFGARYRFRIGDAPGTLSFRVSNVFNKNGWRTNSSEIFVPLTQRRLSVTLAADL